MTLPDLSVMLFINDFPAIVFIDTRTTQYGKEYRRSDSKGELLALFLYPALLRTSSDSYILIVTHFGYMEVSKYKGWNSIPKNQFMCISDYQRRSLIDYN